MNQSMDDNEEKSEEEDVIIMIDDRWENNWFVQSVVERNFRRDRELKAGWKRAKCIKIAPHKYYLNCGQLLHFFFVLMLYVMWSVQQSYPGLPFFPWCCSSEPSEGTNRARARICSEPEHVRVATWCNNSSSSIIGSKEESNNFNELIRNAIPAGRGARKNWAERNS